MTRLRKMMLEELQRRNYAKSTVKAYIRIIQEFANHFHQPPDKLGPQHLRQYQAYLFQEKSWMRHCPAACGRAPLLLCQEVEATLSARRYPQAQTPSQAPGDPESRGNSAAHRLGQ